MGRTPPPWSPWVSLLFASLVTGGSSAVLRDCPRGHGMAEHGAIPRRRPHLAGQKRGRRVAGQATPSLIFRVAMSVDLCSFLLSLFFRRTCIGRSLASFGTKRSDPTTRKKSASCQFIVKSDIFA